MNTNRMANKYVYVPATVLSKFVEQSEHQSAVPLMSDTDFST